MPDIKAVNSIDVNVRLVSSYKTSMLKEWTLITVGVNCTVNNLLAKLASHTDVLDIESEHTVVVLNGQRAGRNQALVGGDEIMIMQPLAGG